MDSRKTEHTPADYVAIVLSPALVMGLVVSLVFFLLEILYAGEYTGRMRWILFFFVFGAVLIARISMQPDLASRAHFYGGILGLLTWIGLLMFVEFPAGSVAAAFAWAINLGLIVLIWWCAHQLTWDCTFLDDRVGSSGQGVLQAAGLDEGGRPQEEEDSTASPDEKDRPEPNNWIDRYWRYREKRSQKRTPGVWVVYFSLAALPIFGLGQSLIPVADAGRRRYTFWLMAVYIGSGLGLLLTTTFLGLRMYLRRRKLQMPVAMTGVWLTVGGALIALLLVGGALLPRPTAEYRLFDIGSAGSKSRHASRANVKEGDPGEEEGDPNNAKQSKEKARSKEKGGERNGDQRGNQNGGQKDGSQSGGQKDKQDSSRGGSGKDRKNDQGGRKDGPRKDGQRGEEKRNSKEEKEGEKSEKEEQDESGRTASQSPRKMSEEVSSWMRKLAPILKWIVFGVMAAVVLFFVLRAFLQFTANFSTFARNLLDSLRRFWEALLALFGFKSASQPAQGDEEVVEEIVPPRPFSSFSNPFHDGRADRLSPEELVRYTFAALQAWASERDLARQSGETPLEFAARVGEQVPPLERDVQRIAILYARAVYARGKLPGTSREVLAKFWEKLARTTEQPLSA